MSQRAERLTWTVLMLLLLLFSGMQEATIIKLRRVIDTQWGTISTYQRGVKCS